MMLPTSTEMSSRRGLSSLFLLLLCVLSAFSPVCTAVDETAIQNGHFAPHSGDLTILPASSSQAAGTGTGRISFQTSDPELLSSPAPGVEATQLFDLFSRVQGLPPRSRDPSPLLSSTSGSSLLPSTVDR